MPQLNPYLSFDGTCTQAMKFYERVLGAKLDALITYSQMSMGDQPVPPSHAERVMHAYLVHPDFSLMAGDMPPGVPHTGMQGIMLALTYPTAEEGGASSPRWPTAVRSRCRWARLSGPTYSAWSPTALAHRGGSTAA